MPARIARLPIDTRGYPVPWFVEWVDGVPEFRAMDPRQWVKAVRDRRCWICGESLGKFLVFVIGPMCGINCTTTEPPCHKDCAEWAVVNCPFLSRPHMRRREDDFTESVKGNAAGIPLDRNPGVTLLWTTTEYRVFTDGRGRPLIQIGPPLSVAWTCEGRDATVEEVKASVESGLPALRDLCEQEPGEIRRMDARKELQRRHAALVALYPTIDTVA
jgi:hypothetical protein